MALGARDAADHLRAIAWLATLLSPTNAPGTIAAAPEICDFHGPGPRDDVTGAPSPQAI